MKIPSTRCSDEAERAKLPGKKKAEGVTLRLWSLGKLRGRLDALEASLGYIVKFYFSQSYLYTKTLSQKKEREGGGRKEKQIKTITKWRAGQGLALYAVQSISEREGAAGHASLPFGDEDSTTHRWTQALPLR